LGVPLWRPTDRGDDRLMDRPLGRFLRLETLHASSRIALLTRWRIDLAALWSHIVEIVSTIKRSRHAGATAGPTPRWTGEWHPGRVGTSFGMGITQFRRRSVPIGVDRRDSSVAVGRRLPFLGKDDIIPSSRLCKSRIG